MPVTRQTKQAKAKPVEKEAEEPEEKETSDRSMSEADLFDSTKAMGVIEPGKYEALISELVLQDKDEKGRSVRIKYEIASEGEMRGEQATQWYKIFDEAGQPAKGAQFLKKDLAVLGYADVKFKELEEVFDEIVEKQLGVLIQVKLNQGYTNVYLQGLSEGSDVITDYLENRPPY
jgi:hypothetical protein